MKRGEIWWVNLDPTVGSEIQKTRPAVIIQNDIGNQVASTTIVAPITSTIIDSPITVSIEATKQNGLKNKSCINAAQIRCVDKTRLIKRLGVLSSDDIQLVNNALMSSLAL